MRRRDNTSGATLASRPSFESFEQLSLADRGEAGPVPAMWRPAHPNRPLRSGAIQSFQHALLIAQTGADQGLAEWVYFDDRTHDQPVAARATIIGRDV
jgi:hypothetical protein